MGRRALLLALGLAGVLAACGAGNPTVGRAPGIEPVSNPNAVIAAALARIDLMQNVAGCCAATPRVLSLTAMTGSEARDTVGWNPRGLENAIVWLVRAEGTFALVIPGEPIGFVLPTAAPAGWIIVRDADATVVASGWP